MTAVLQVKSLPQYQKIRHIESGVWMPAWAAHKWQGQSRFLPAKWQLSIYDLRNEARVPQLSEALI